MFRPGKKARDNRHTTDRLTSSCSLVRLLSCSWNSRLSLAACRSAMAIFFSYSLLFSVSLSRKAFFSLITPFLSLMSWLTWVRSWKYIAKSIAYIVRPLFFLNFTVVHQSLSCSPFYDFDGLILRRCRNMKRGENTYKTHVIVSGPSDYVKK